MELVGSGNVAACFRVMSNELGTSKILLCPADTRRVWATNFSADFDNSHISYFVGLDITNETSPNPQMFLSGDDNFAISGIPVKSGVLQLLINTPAAWTIDRHPGGGNIGLADTSVEQLPSSLLQRAFQLTGVATNRLAIP
jgi:prepilin-type processing-associated H-X9-DG protein